MTALEISESKHCAFGHIPVVFAKNLFPIRDIVQVAVERQLWFNDTANTIICAKVWVKVGDISKTMFHPIASLSFMAGLLTFQK